MGVGKDVDVAAITAVSATGPAARNKFFAAEGNTAVSAITGFDCDFGFVNERGSIPLARSR